MFSILKYVPVVKLSNTVFSVFVLFLLAACTDAGKSTSANNEGTADNSNTLLLPVKMRSHIAGHSDSYTATISIDGAAAINMTRNGDSFELNLPGLELGEHSVFIIINYIDTDNGGTVIPVATLSKNVAIAEGANSFPAVDPVNDYIEPDNDGDGRSNFDELSDGTNPLVEGRAISGTFSEFIPTSIELHLNGAAHTFTIQNDQFSFPERIDDSDEYIITVATPPANTVCEISNGNGTVSSTNISNIEIYCIKIWFIDNDSDGFGNSFTPLLATTQPQGYVSDNRDCNDTNSAINPAATEINDGIDNDCDDQVDEGFKNVTWYQDLDGDNYGNINETVSDVSAPEGYVAFNTDCNDDDAAIYPGQSEKYDQVDNNCNNQIDEGFNPVDWYQDLDGDNYGNINVVISNITAPENYVADSSDCNDSNAQINAGAVEVYDLIDNNCNGEIDEANTISNWYQDLDNDNYGNGNVVLLAQEKPLGYVSDNSDCDDLNNTIYPGANEISDLKDNDCDGNIDEDIGGVGGGIPSWYQDSDNDGYGNTHESIAATSKPIGYVANNTDCDDANNAIHPTAEEINDQIDNNCDGNIDELIELSTWYQDLDDDNYGNPDSEILAAAKPAGYVSDNTDCNDENNTIYPTAPELADQLDNNCDGQVDEILALQTWYQDADNDSYGNDNSKAISISPPAGYVSNNTDCDDTDVAINPAANELLDQIDNNCNNLVDEGFSIAWYQDLDGDNYGNVNVSIEDSGEPEGYVTNNTDCDDGNIAINPGATEIYDQVDNNCNGETDEDFVIWYFDEDNDGYGSTSLAIFAVNQPNDYVSNNTDCNDANSAINPGAAEIYDLVDNNCSGVIDDNFVKWYFDEDNDTFGTPTLAIFAVLAPTNYVDNNSDCNDADADINPDATEVYDQIDNNCTGIIDDNFVEWFIDSDNDTFGSDTLTTHATSKPVDYVDNSSDCDDGNANINPSVAEAFDPDITPVDDNCNGQIDEGFVVVTWYQDLDNDSYGNLNVTTQDISQPTDYVDNSTDCNDGDAAINPAAIEEFDEVDNNCNGEVDEGIPEWFADSDNDSFGDASSSTFANTKPEGFVSNTDDCDDSNAAINPNAIEVFNQVDDNCNDEIDEGTSYSVSGNISDLQGEEIGLSLNGAAEILISGSSFSFSAEVENNTPYEVTITTLPPLGRFCIVDANASGDGSNGDILNVSIQCSASTLTKTQYTDDDGDGVVDSIYTTVYNVNGRVISQSYDYDADGFADVTYSYIYNLNDNQTSYSYDADGDGQADWIYSYTYDANDNQTRYAYDADGDGQANWVYMYTYNASDQRTQQTYDSDGDGLPNSIYVWVYDNNGNNILNTRDNDADGDVDITYTYAYDANNRQTYYSRDDDGDGLPNYSYAYAYDSNGNTLEYSYDNDGVGATPASVTTYNYDANDNRTLQSTDSNDDGIPDRVYTYTYNINNQQTLFTYDSDGAGPLSPSITTYAYDANSNQILNAYDSNGDGSPERIYTYAYDANSNQTLNSYDSDGDGSPNRIYTYAYDANSNQTLYTYDSIGDGSPDWVRTYTYDANDNKIEETHDDPVGGIIDTIYTFAYDASNNLIARTYDYDGDGIIDETYSASFDEENNQTSYAYDYDADGNGDYTYIESYDGEGNRIEEYFYQYPGDTYWSSTTTVYDIYDRLDNYFDEYFDLGILYQYEEDYSYEGDHRIEI